MQITFSKEEFISMLSNVWGIPLSDTDIVFDFNELTGEVQTLTITGMDPVSLARIGAVTQGLTPKTQQRLKVVIANKASDSPQVIDADPAVSDESTVEDDQDELDEIIRKSRELALQGQQYAEVPDEKQNELLMYSGASEEFPLDFANRVLGK